MPRVVRAVSRCPDRPADENGQTALFVVDSKAALGVWEMPGRSPNAHHSVAFGLLPMALPGVRGPVGWEDNEERKWRRGISVYAR